MYRPVFCVLKCHVQLYVLTPLLIKCTLLLLAISTVILLLFGVSKSRVQLYVITLFLIKCTFLLHAISNVTLLPSNSIVMLLPAFLL